MARLPHPTQAHLTLTLPQAGLAAMTLLLCAFALFMCASHSRKWRNWIVCYDLYDHEPVIHLETEDVTNIAGVDGVIDTGNVNDQSLFSGEQEVVPVWQKNILMGGKCQLPDFSGVIIYDSEGNVVTNTKARPLLTWK